MAVHGPKGRFAVRYQDCTGTDEVDTYMTKDNAEAAIRFDIENVGEWLSCANCEDDGHVVYMSDEDQPGWADEELHDWARWTRMY